MRQSLRSPLAASLALALCACDKEAKQAPAPPPPEVKVVDVVQRDVPVYMEAIGETRGNAETEIRARVEGFIDTVEFQEGMPVTKGQLLYTIDPAPFEASLAQSQASLAEAEAQLARAHQDVVRYEPLVAKNAIAREVYETSVAQEKAANAAVDASKAVVERSKIDLSYTKVMAPEEGLAGKTEVYPGTLVGRGQSTLLTRISRIDPIHVRFSFPESDYLVMARQRGSGVGDGGANIPFELVMADGSVHPKTGKLVFVDRNVDAQTGTIMAEAEFENPGDIVRPGQYARVRATVGERKGAILVPQRAVQEVQGIFNVMVVGDGNTVEQRPVETAERIDSLWVIASGLKSGDRVIVEGLQKVRPKMAVNAQEVPIEEKKDGAKETKPAADDAAHAKKPAHESESK